MADYEQPDATPDKPTKVTSFTMHANKLTITISRPTDTYNYRDPEPRVSDLPPDYVAALMTWMRGALR